MKKIVIVGSGFSSLANACYLAKAGADVTLIEKNEQLGGRASILQAEGFTFDMGPSWYWMPDIFENFFADFGKKVTDYYELEKLSPAYKVVFNDKDSIDIADNIQEIAQEFDQLDPGSGKRLQTFIEKARKNYKIAMSVVYKPGISLLELVTPGTASRLGLFIKTISQDVKKVSSHPYLKSILEFPVLFLGAKPSKTPAFYNFMNYADFGMGTWYPKGGMHQIIKAMVSLAHELGVKTITNEEVTGFTVENKKVTGVQTKANQYPADLVISGADYAHTEELLGTYRNYPSTYWEKKTFAPSSFLYYVGFKGTINNLEHHNLFFDTDFERHAEEIYDEKVFPEQPLFYVNFPSKSDKSLAPEGMSTAFFLVPIAVDLDDNKEIHEQYFKQIVERMEAFTGESFLDRIVFKRSFGVNDFKERYHSCKGNAYGLANTLLQTSILKPGIRNKQLNNFFYTGQLTVPGPGVPPSLISGKVVADYILKNGL